MTTGDRHARAAALLAALLAEPELRAGFRDDPAAACRSFDLPPEIAALHGDAGAALTLEPRESRSGLAGAMIGAAAQGVAVAEHALRQMSGADASSAHLRAAAVLAPDRAVTAGAGDEPPPVAERSVKERFAFVDGPRGDRPTRPQLAAWMGRNAAAAGLPEPLGVMAALSASDLHDMRDGAGDAFGYFAMSKSSWNHGPYRGFAEDRERQLAWFLDRAAVVRAEHVAGGDRVYGEDPSTWRDWIAEVLGRRGDRDRGSLQAAQRLLPEPPPATGARSAAAIAEQAGIGKPAAGGERAQQAVQIAKRYLGQPYLWGGSQPRTGFDCSGLVQYAYSRVGVELPRVTHQQFAVGEHVDRGALRAGDIVFFRDGSGYIHHEGLYLADGKFLHAPHTGDVIKVSSLDEAYYAQQFAGGRRVGALGRAR